RNVTGVQTCALPIFRCFEFLEAAGKSNFAAVCTSAWTKVNYVVSNRDGLWLMLNDQHCIALIAQLQQGTVHALNICWVQASGGLIEYVGGIGQRGTQVSHHA